MVDFRWLPKLMLWGMLIFACLGAVSSLFRPQTDLTTVNAKVAIEQDMAIHTALSFAREWMRWDGEELPEARMQRLRPYVNPDALVRVASLQSEQKANRQQVIAAEFVSLSRSDGPSHTVRLRVIVLNPSRMVWEVDVPVWVQAGKGAVVTAPPLVRTVQEPFAVLEIGSDEASAPAEIKQRMRPAMESFLKAMCEGTDADGLFNYVTTDAALTPLQGRLRFLALERMEATGVGLYTVTVVFLAQDEATGFRFPQVWELTVVEENQKFFVSSVE